MLCEESQSAMVMFSPNITSWRDALRKKNGHDTQWYLPFTNPHILRHTIIKTIND
jgi:hypothetical protein